MSVLNVNESVRVDNAIINSELHTHQPYTTRFGNNDEIRIPIQEDMCTLPSQSHLYIEGKLLRQDNTVSLGARFINNGIAFLFSEIRYEMNGVVVDSISKVGLTTTMKGLISLTPNDAARYENSGWFPTTNSTIVSPTGHFNVCLPLGMLLGFAEDYRKVVLNIRQELVLIRSNSDTDAVYSATADEALKVDIEKIYWKVPHILPALAEELALTKYIDKNINTQVAFRSWETHVYPALPQTDKHTWAIKTATSLETPRYIILGFQTGRDGKVNQDMSKFDQCGIENVRVFLNTERYPYDNLNINYLNNRYASLYEMYAAFQSSYYETEGQPLLTPDQFKQNAPLIVIDCSHQKDSLNSKAVVLRVEFDTSANVAANTTAMCLILHDKVFTYNALTKAVRQL
ncbi:uncharacterized protein LOC116180021 [Photinus pyralis]|uniref:uncharacterized protein LOC116172709 n=1 Tax=Photinus pyralis TaxID=7054 RepID=UPI00126703D5|nr:uncharacterized protein LOC116172709 [Photinus pyralis]XP_031349514.1 uncharacterized protein LOC116175504 [Photinus pyralis]XP_031355704.1 uncharacterized protein LOC116180021 [Photinus pyralis]